MTMMNERTNGFKTGVHICVLGGIGSGKSSLTKAFEEVIREESGNCRGLYEPASKTNPYLADYYKDQGRYCFNIQIFLLNKRLEQQRLAQDVCLCGENVVQDSSIYSDSCFVSKLEKDGTMSKRDADTYFELFQNMSRDIMYPTAVIYLDVTPEVQIHRIEKRMSEKEGRKCEAGIGLDYLKDLQIELEQLLTGLQRYTHVIRVNWLEDKSPQQIKETARQLYHDILTMRRVEPIRCFIGL